MSFICNLCPRGCNILRDDTAKGYCGGGEKPRIARAAPHFWEEPPISGTRGSGAVFFSGCNLRCVFCQNYDISAGNFGKTVTSEQLKGIFQRLIAQNVHNINLVTAAHYLEPVLEALSEPLPVPVVWNTSSYETVESLRRLSGKVQIYLPDMKYSMTEPAAKYSFAPDYPEVAKAAILEMFRQVGPYRINEEGIMESGIIIRHLVMPGNLENTFGVIDWVADTFKPGDVMFSLMSQYTPAGRAGDFPELNRRLTAQEYSMAKAYMEAAELEDGFYQELSSAKEEYTPPFDLTGVE